MIPSFFELVFLITLIILEFQMNNTIFHHLKHNLLENLLNLSLLNYTDDHKLLYLFDNIVVMLILFLEYFLLIDLIHLHLIKKIK